jgi:ubiquinone/menaquinone biosynthesis C-methylase UbiE
MNENPFDSFTDEYEAWFRENENLFQSELLALMQVIPFGKKGLEIGIGSGIFAEHLNIGFGIDPSENMLAIASKRGCNVVKGVAENLPFPDESFDFTAFITSLCFVDNPEKAIVEAHRILKPDGEIIIAFIDKDTAFGKFLEKGKEKSKFYKHANFFSVSEIITLLETFHFNVSSIFQTLENPGNTDIEQPIEGFGKGSFVVVKGEKQLNINMKG